MNSWIQKFGIRFRIHPLFSVVLFLSIAGGYFIEMATLFGIVLVHEMGHAMTAKTFGWRVKEIMLLPFGGEAVIEEQGSVPVWQEIVVIIAGPLQNIGMIVIAQWLHGLGLIAEQWTDYFIQANLFIALFNLLPISPLDGGRLLHVLLGVWLPYHRVITFTIRLSLLLSLLLTAMSLLHMVYGSIQMNLLIIGVFLIGSNLYAYKGRSYHFMRFLLYRETTTNRLINKGTAAKPIVVDGQQRVADIVRLFMREQYHLVYMLDQRGAIRTVVPEQLLLHTYFNESKRGCAISELFM